MLLPAMREVGLSHRDRRRQGLTIEKHDVRRGDVVTAGRHGMPFLSGLALRLRACGRVRRGSICTRSDLVLLQSEDRFLAEQVGELRWVKPVAVLPVIQPHYSSAEHTSELQS